MFFSIIPFSHSIGVQPLIYSGGDRAMDDLRVWQIIEIPYGKSIENGIIAAIHIDSPIDITSESYTRIKPIHQTITSSILLAQYQLEMISEMSKRYMIPIHRVLAIFLTRPILSRLERKNYAQIVPDTSRPTPQKTQKPTHSIQIVQDYIVTPILVETYTKKWPTIVILPDDYAMMPYREMHIDRRDILFVPNEMTDTRRAQAWIDITNGVFPIIYWTRKILYYNLSAYQHIIYIEDALGPDYWHYPIRIDYADILYIFAQSNPHIGLTILTSVPTLRTLTHFRYFRIENITGESTIS